jgi:antimicrobial peptide system SdpA family protein
MSKRIFLYITTWVLLITLMIIVLCCTITDSVIQFNETFKSSINSVIPEGWSFFTRSPREEMADIYRIGKNKKLEKVSFQCSASENYFGISRKSRRIGMEISIVASKLSDSLWIKNKNYNNNLLDSIPTNNVTVDKDVIFLTKGDYLIKAFLPIPWAWAKSTSTKPKERFIRIKII